MPNPLTKKVLLIGWDAADWKVITPLLDAGKMPHLERFVSQGVMGNLATLSPILSPMLWTSIATGKRAYKHGIHGFSEPDPQTGGVRPITNLGRKCKAIWNILNQHGKRSNVVGWWPSHPAEPINGVMVSNHFQQVVAPPDKPWPMRPGTVHPPHLVEALSEFRVHPAELEPEQILPFVPKAAEVDQHKDKRLFSVAKILAETASTHAAATALMQLEPWDFMAVYFDAIDHFCHGFMRYHPPRLDWISERDYELYKDVVNGAYQFHDLMLGTYMELAGEDATLIIVSDHGFHPDHLRPKELPNEPAGPADEHRQFGVIAMHGPNVKKDQLVFGANLLDITPTVLTLFGLPVGMDMDGKPLVTAFETPPEVEYLESWDAEPGDAGTHPPDARVDPVDAQEALKQLVELGYIDKPDEDQEKAVANTIKELKHNLARDYFDARRFTEAISLFKALWEQYPDEGRFGVKLFDSHLALGRTAEAREALDRIVSEKQRYAGEAQEELKRLNKEWKDRKPGDLKEDEVRQLNRLRKRAGVNTATFAYLRGRLLYAEGEYEKALQTLREAEQVQVHNRPSLYQKMGEAYLALKLWGNAEQRFNEILEIDPVNPSARLGLCQCHLARKRYRKALKEVTAAIGLVYHNPQAHFLCGRILRRLKRGEEALQALQTALAQNPVFPDAHRELAALYDKQKEPEKAAEHRELAQVSEKRIADFKAGKPLPQDVDLELDLRLKEHVSLGDLGVTQAPGPLPEDAVVIVSGLPRSGTSMMMQMLAAGGLPLMSDGVRAADESNPRGYYELEEAKKVGKDNAWLKEAGGKGVKIVAQLLARLPQGQPYRIIFMERRLGEVVASQAAMLERLGREGGRLSERQLANTYLGQIDQVRRVLAAYPEQIAVLGVNYEQALKDPAAAATRVNAFLGGSLDEGAMATAVEPSLRHQTMAESKKGSQ